MFKRIQKISHVLSQLNLRFDLPIKRKIILFDDQHSLILKEIVNKDFNILYIREKKQIYFWILLKQIIFFNFNFMTYCKNYIKYTSPKIVITFIENNIQFYELKNSFSDIHFIAVENGLRGNEFFKSKRIQKAKKLKCDHIFVYNKHLLKKYEKIIKSNFHILGSFKNNLVNINKTKVYGEFLYISEYFFFSDDRRLNSQINLLNLINVYLSNNNKKLHILIKNKTLSRQKKEVNFYKNLFKSNCVIHKTSYWKNSYKLLDKYENIIFSSSSLGHEAIARKKKVAIFSPKTIGKVNYHFGWPAPIEKKYNFFLTQKPNKEEVKRVLNNVKNCSQANWEKKYFSILNDQLSYNKNNKTLKKKISELLII